MPVRPAQDPPRQLRIRRRRRIRKLRLLALVAVLCLLGLSSFTFGLVAAIASEIPSLDPARQQMVERNGYVYAADGRTVLAVLRGSENRVLLEPEEIAPIMKQAIVAIEDRRFFEHRGIDLRGIVRALWADIRHQRVVEGGSTITQQFVKNAYSGNERTLARKVREAALAWQLEERWGHDKDRILTAYLNTIYFGNGAYGIQQAAKVYFGKGARSLELHETALLAGIPADPSRFDPVARPRAAAARRDIVLRAMLEQGNIRAVDFRAARQMPLPRAEDVRLPGIHTPHAPYFTNYVKDQLVDRYGAQRVFGGGLRVTTTIDLDLQRLAREAVAEWLPDPQDPEAAVVALDPTTGNVLAMVGGRNYRASQFNLAVQSERQPGSAFKPFALAAALEQGISPATRFISKPISIPLGDREWTVANYEDSYLGQIDLETATIHSDNSVYAQLTRLVTPRGVVRTAERLGITSPLENYFSIALGAQAVNPLELARAYAALANGGYRIDVSAPREELRNRPRVIESVADQQGGVVDPVRPVSRQVLSPRTVGYVNLLLQRTMERGTGRRAALPGRPAAGKTGTTENYGDAWFVGYTPQLVAVVWVGYPNELRPMLTEFEGEPVAGGTFPALIWKSFMENGLAHLGKEPVRFAQPPSLYMSSRHVVARDGKVQLDNGLCRERVEVVYFAGFGPEETADCRPNEVDVPRVTGKTLVAAKERLEAQPLTPVLAYRPARPGERLNVVLDQRPKGGRLSSFDEVTLVLPKPLHGAVPDVRGVPVAAARERLRKLGLRPHVRAYVDGPPGLVVSQSPRPGVAAAPDMVVELAVSRG